MSVSADRYRLVERIALGGSAEVWRAHDDRLDRPVAVKLLHGHLLPDERSRERLEAEARRAAGLNHPGIATVYDVAVEGERPAVVLELVDGESLAVRLEREGRMHPRDAARMALEISRALMHAHEHGVVHRDVKPGNILLDRDGQARLIDFGIARSLADAADGLTLTGTMVGALRYMAPEQLTDGTIDERSDVYAVGVVLHEALSGDRPSAPRLRSRTSSGSARDHRACRAWILSWPASSPRPCRSTRAAARRPPAIWPMRSKTGSMAARWPGREAS